MEYITKPFDPDDLTRVVERVLTSSADELEQARRATIDRCGGP
jgi:DNA-binding NtrC family response regulator